MIKNLPNLKQVLAALLTIAALATGQTAWAWDGSGTSDSPWLIKTTNDLVALANNSASTTYSEKFFRLENDLDMNGVAIGTIGGNSKRFKGTFDGNGHAIRNLTINKPDDDFVGLFGIISANSTIRNLIIDGANITGNNNVGVIFGCTFNGGTIENCLVVNSSVTVTSSTGTYGGIISGCYLDNLTFSGNYYYNCSVTMGSNAPVTTNIATTGGDIDGAAIADATATVSLPDAWVTFGANQFLVGGYYYNGTIYYDSSIGYTVGPATWAALQTAFNNASTDAEHPTELTLAADITASASDSYLNLTGGRKVILDLNGHTLSRGLTAATTDGYVIRVIGTNTSLTIRDGATGGTITGGWSNSGPGCISVTSNATLRLESGTISGNRVNRSGGTISITGGSVYITGGTITGNWANIETWNNNSFASCGAIYFNEGGTLYMSGGAITGNRCRTTTLGAAGIGASLMLSHRVHLSGSYNISGNEQGDYDEATGEWSNLTPSDILNNNRTLYFLDGPINPVAPAHMILDHDGSSATFTSGWATHMGSTDPEQCFTLDPATGKGLGIVDGEVHVGTLHTLTLADGLTASVTQAAQGKSVTLSGAAAPVTTGGITYTTDYIVSYNDGTNDHVDHYTADDQGNATFVMPDANVTVSTETVASVTYIDADGNEQTITDFTIVSSSYEFGDDFGTGTALLGVDDYTERWYAVVGTVSLDKRLSVEGNARLILCDAAALIVNADYDCGTAFDVSYNGLTIYGQAQGTGTLSVTNTGGAIHVSNNITVNGGTVIATSTDIFDGIHIFNGRTLTINRGTLTASGGNGININGTLTQNGGTLSATGAYGISIDEGTLTLNGGTLNATGSGTNYAGIYATYDATVNILGGTLNATGTADAYGIYATGDGTTVTLGWTTPDDRITASSYSGTVKIADGKALKNGGTVYYGTLTAAQKSAIANVTLQPATQAEFIAAALPQTGTNEYTIYDSVGWNALCDALQDNDTWNRFSGDTVKLGADITVTRMAGSSHCDFCGIFDGQGHTLTVNIHSDNEHEYTAPFSYISETTPTGGSEVSHPAIRNLNVAGTVTATKDYAGGIVGAFWGTLTIENCSSSVTINTNNKHAAGFIGYAAGNATITNCLSSVTINSSVSGDGTHAGFIGGSHSGTTFTIEGCAFTGSLLTTNGTNRCAGFVGYNSGTLTITNSLYAPDSVNVGATESATFARNGATITNCYYTTDFNDGVHFTAQGKQARSITADDYVTVENAGTATTYSVSGITSYGTGIKYNNVLYAGKNEVVSLTLSNTVPASFNFTGYSVTDGASLNGSGNNYTLTMPNAEVDVVITANCTIPPVSYIDENGVAQTCTYYYPLEGTETTLGAAGQETWCVVQGTLNYSHGIQLLGNTHIILCDGAAMNIGTSDNPVSGTSFQENVGFYGDENNLSLYAQSGNTGTLTIYPQSRSFEVKDLTITGGNVNTTTISSNSSCIVCNNLTVCRSSLEIHAKNVAVQANDVALSNVTANIISSNSTGFSCSNFAVDNSQLTVTAYYQAIGASVITLGCTAATDFIKATCTSFLTLSYYGTVKIADGQTLYDGANAYTGTLTDAERQTIGGRKLTNVAPPTYDYIGLDGTGATHTAVVIDADNMPTALSGWYIVQGTVNYTNTIDLAGDTHIILADNAVMNVTVTGYIHGVSGNYSLFVYGQTGQSGELNVTSNSIACFISGGDITIAGGKVTASGTIGIYAQYYNNGGNVTIKNATVTATGTSLHGILSENSGNITIDNSNVTATGNYGIYAQKGDITIASGTVTASGTQYGIFTGNGSVTINGGQVTATGNFGIYTIGSVTINGGQVSATGNTYGIFAQESSDHITLGWTNPTDFIYVNKYYTYGTLSIAEGKAFIDEAGQTYSGPVAMVSGVYPIDGKRLYPYIEGSVPYIDENGQRQLCTDYNVLNGTETSLGTAGQETWYVADGTLNYGQTITLSGNVHLILKDNAVMNVGTQSTINYGIGDESSTASISIYGQSTGNSQGQLHVNASAVGIFAKDGNLTINGGEVVVTSSYGLGIFANGGNVIINGGEVEATGNNTNGEGIFATKNSSGNGGSISISNATVTANGSIGIQANSGITINSGTVTANNCNYYGIYASSCSLTISGGQVTANGSTYGIYAEGGNVTISGGQVTANGSTYDIYATYGNITISGGQVTANGSTYGIYAEVGNVNISGGEVEATGNNTNGNGGGILAIKRNGNGGNISISNATVTATGSIGIHAQSGITINSGTVTANNCNYGIYADVSNLTISGGQVTANGNSCGIFGDNITITSGEVTANGPYGIYANNGNLIISGGEVTANGPYGIYANNGNLIISGGQVTANGNSCGIFGDNITLGWTNASDFIYANSYYATGTLSIAEGKAFKDVDGNNYESGPVNASDINGKWLYPNTVSLFTKIIAAHHTVEGVNYGWYLIASPLSGETNAEAVAHLVNSETPANFDLYRFNQAADLEWENWKQQNSDHYHFNLEPGRGYLYANAAVVNLVFAGTPYSGNGKVTLQKTEGAELSGWNLVGNPFTVSATLTQPYYRMNDEGSALKTETETTAVAAMEGVFVQANQDSQTVTFTAQTRGGEKAAIAQANIMVGGNNGAVIDNAIVRFDGGQTLEKFSFREGSTKLYIPQDGKDYAIACAESTGEMPVNFKAETDGTYTISVNVYNVEMGYLHLIDNMTGSDIDLLAMNNGDARPCVSTYTFTAKTTDYESRFKLVFAVGSSTGSDTFAFFSNGNWIVSNEGHATLQVIDVNGRILISEQINGSISKAINQPAGVYMLRLVKGENVRTQKIVVE